jgi:hypothetical protein
MTSTELRTHLLTLTAERAATSLDGDHAGRSDDLLAEIEAARHAFVGAAVTEIASFRAQLSGPLIG